MKKITFFSLLTILAFSVFGQTAKLNVNNTAEKYALLRPNKHNNEVRGLNTKATNVITCDAASLFGNNLENLVSASHTDLEGGYKGATQFQTIGGTVETLTFWGINGFYDGAAWSQCTEVSPLTVDIEFAENNAGAIGAITNTFDNVTATVTNSGEMLFGAYTIWQYEVTLPSPVSLTNGFLIIGADATANATDCWFMWITSSSAFGNGYQWDGTAWAANDAFTVCMGGTPPSCSAPTNLDVTSTTTNSAYLTWQANGASLWNVELVPAGTPATGVPTHEGISALPMFLPGLAMGTEYDFYVQADCGGVFSSWSGPFTFFTPNCAAASQCAYELIMTDTYGDDWNGASVSVIENGIEIANVSADGSGYPQTVAVDICDAMPVEFIWNKGSWDEETGLVINDPFGTEVTSFVAPAADLFTDGQVLASITSSCTPPACAKPNTLAADPGMTDAILSWNEMGTATAWNIELGAAGFTPTGTPTNSAVTNPFTATGLTAGTAYAFYVQADCSGTTSDWAGPFTFTTANCELINMCDYTFDFTDAYGDGWNGNMLTVVEDGVEVAVLTGEADASQAIVGLCAGATIEFVWTVGGWPEECGLTVTDPNATVIYSFVAGDATAFTDAQVLHTFTNSCTPPTCPKPMDLTATNITDVSADLGWTEIGTATSWNIELGAAGFTPTGTPTNSAVANPFAATGLTASTAYDYYVQGDCGAGDLSSWAGPFTFSTNCAGGNASIVINFKTDGYPEEMYWAVFDYSGTPIAFGGEAVGGTVYGANAEYTEIVCVDPAGCYTFSIYDTYGDGLIGGYYEVIYDGTQVAFNDAYDTDQEIVMNMGSGCPALDLAVASIDGFDYLVTNTPFTISGEILNLGTDDVTAFDLNWSIDGGAVNTDNISATVTGNGGAYIYTASATWTPTMAGVYELAVWTSNPNGSADEMTANDTMYKTISVADVLAQRLALMEGFTSSTCAPCATVNPGLDALIASNSAKITAVKYHVGWPSPGDDPMYAFNMPEVDSRVSFYGVNAVPNSVLGEFNGNSADIDQVMIDNEYAKPSPVNIAGTFTLAGQDLTVAGGIDAVAELVSSDLVYHVAVVEKLITYATAPGTNGETEFHNVFRKLLPDDAGTAVPALGVGAMFPINQTWTVDASIDLAELGVVVWLQDAVTGEVHQAANFPLYDGISETGKEVSMYPNPTKDMVHFANVENSTISIYNMIGEVVDVIDSRSTMTTVNVSEYAKGTYVVKIQSAEGVSTLKLNVIR